MAEINDIAKITTKVQNIINKVRPYIQKDGGDVEFVEIKDNIVYVRMLGACVGCSSLDTTLKDGIEAIILEEVEGIIGVENIA